MKKIILIILIAIVSFSAQAQEAGGGLSYGMDIEKIALNLKVNYSITEKIYASASANLFMPEKIEVLGVEFCSALTTVNIDGHYRFSFSDDLLAYPLVGLNYARLGMVAGETELEAETYFGLNIGAGAKYKEFFTELKLVTGDAGQLVFTLGYIISLD